MRQAVHWADRLASVLASALAPAAVGGAESALRAHEARRALRDDPSVVTVVALGDSIAAGWPGPREAAWPARLAVGLAAAHPRPRWRVLNTGIPGDTAPMGLARFDRHVARARAHLVLIGFGLNDCVLAPLFEGGEPQLRTPPEAYSAALAELVARGRAIGAQPVLLTMTPLASSSALGVQVRLAAYDAYNARIREAAARAAIPLVALASGQPDGALESDGFHLSALGQAWVAQQVLAQLAAAGVWEALAGRATGPGAPDAP